MVRVCIDSCLLTLVLWWNSVWVVVGGHLKVAYQLGILIFPVEVGNL